MRIKNKTKQGAASFYVVAFSTLIILIVVASFTALVVAQITRSSNDELSQSAYDSALAGVEDAKLAYYNYQSCVAQGVKPRTVGDNEEGPYDCAQIIDLVQNHSDDCDVVAKILGRNYKDEDGNNVGVLIDETSGGNASNNMQQYYTCAKLQTKLKNYISSISSENPLKVVNVKIDNTENASINANAVKKVKLSWGSNLSSGDVELSNYASSDGGGEVVFPKVSSETKAANPPTISFALVQAESEYKMESFDLTVKDDVAKIYQTNRAMVYLTPVTTKMENTSGKEGNYQGTTFTVDSNGAGFSQIPVSAMVDSNNASKTNIPYGVSCPYAGQDQFACAAMIYLPDPIDDNGDGTGVRSDDNFVVAISLPYGESTDFMLEFFCGDGDLCRREVVSCAEDDTECVEEDFETEQVGLKDMQIGVDSTGRANDLFRRVDTRLEGSGDFAISVMGPLELFGDGDGGDGGDDGSASLIKNYAVTCEYEYNPTNNYDYNKGRCDQ